MLHLTVLTEGPGNPPLRRLRRELRDWIDGLDVDEIAALSAVSDSFFTDQSAPRYTWTQAGWSIEFGVIPLKPEAKACRRIRQLSVAELLAESMRRIAEEDSVSELFME